MEPNTTLQAAIQTVVRTADTQTCLNPELRDALRVVASAARDKSESAELTALKDLVHHAWIHSGYKDMGYNKMDVEQRQLYDSLKAEWRLDRDE